MKPVYEAFAVFDPNWGDPVPVLTTIRGTEAESIAAAIVDPDLTIYSGASLARIPAKPGSWDLLVSSGYRVAKIAITPNTGE